MLLYRKKFVLNFNKTLAKIQNWVTSCSNSIFYIILFLCLFFKTQFFRFARIILIFLCFFYQNVINCGNFFLLLLVFFFGNSQKFSHISVDFFLLIDLDQIYFNISWEIFYRKCIWLGWKVNLKIWEFLLMKF